jgi:protocatechuate 3,4-dioxygenase beta subunit
LPQPEPGTAIVSGVVTLKGKPSCCVTIRLLDQSPRSYNKYFVGADENGRFRIPNVAAGKYLISARAPGHIFPVGYDIEVDVERPLNVGEGEKIENIALEAKRLGVIAGRVTDSRGVPMIGEAIYLHRLDKDGKPQPILHAARQQTDDRGVYRLYGLPEGRYLVSVDYAVDRAFFYPGMTSQSEAKAIEVAEESEVAGIDITLPDRERSPIAGAVTGEINVRLVTEDGEGLPNVNVNITSITKNSRPISALGWRGYLYNTDANGNFKFREIGPENEPRFYWVRATHAEVYAPKSLFNQPVGNDNTVVMVKGGVITGRITNADGEPVVSANARLVTARDAEGKQLMLEGVELWIAADDRGVYRFWGLTPGTYFVFTDNNIEKAAEVTVRGGVETSGIDLRYRTDLGRIK